MTVHTITGFEVTKILWVLDNSCACNSVVPVILEIILVVLNNNSEIVLEWFLKIVLMVFWSDSENSSDLSRPIFKDAAQVWCLLKLPPVQFMSLRVFNGVTDVQ